MIVESYNECLVLSKLVRTRRCPLSSSPIIIYPFKLNRWSWSPAPQSVKMMLQSRYKLYLRNIRVTWADYISVRKGTVAISATFDFSFQGAAWGRMTGGVWASGVRVVVYLMQWIWTVRSLVYEASQPFVKQLFKKTTISMGPMVRQTKRSIPDILHFCFL